MNKKLIFGISFLMMAMSIMFTSCDNNDDEDYKLLRPSALVTVKPTGDSFVMQVTDDTRLVPSNIKESPFGDVEVRAFVNFKEEGALTDMQSVTINWIDSIRTKKAVPSLGDQNDSTYGNDPIEIVRDVFTVAEDGYLTLRVRARWGVNQIHYLNVVSGVSDDPFELELRHDARGDLNGLFEDSYIAFNLRDLMKESTDEKVQFTLKWRSYEGDKKLTFELLNK